MWLKLKDPLSHQISIENISVTCPKTKTETKTKIIMTFRKENIITLTIQWEFQVEETASRAKKRKWPGHYCLNFASESVERAAWVSKSFSLKKQTLCLPIENWSDGTLTVRRGTQYNTSMGGGSIKSKESKSFTPIALSDSIVLAKLVLWISGTAVGSISSLYARSVYSR